MEHRSITVCGSVQGVMFRRSAKKIAEKVGVVGFVRNLPDGSVYIEAEGEEVALGKFTEWCRKGPLFSRIEKIEVVGGEMKNFRDFKIL